MFHDTTQKKIDIDKAEQQILGFYHCWIGYDLTSLCESMALKREEFDEMMKKEMLHYLPKELGDEIVEYIKNLD